jgi:hypothetical protein
MFVVVREPIPGKEETKLGKPLRFHAQEMHRVMEACVRNRSGIETDV